MTFELVAIDVGNSTVTVARMAGGRVVDRRVYAHREGDAAATLEGAAHYVAEAPPHVPLALAGVRPRTQEILLQILCDGPRVPSGRPVWIAPVDFLPPIENACQPPEKVGLDRLFDAAAAFHRGGGPVVVVDVGTAITVDLVDAGGVFRGGAIAPGVRLCFEALHRETGLLPLIVAAIDEAVPVVGTDTPSAIRSGVLRGLAGLIDRLAEEVTPPGGARGVLTGGASPLLLPLLRRDYRYEPDLILEGIALGASRRVAGRQ